MAALTADRNTPARDGKTFSFPVKAASKIFAGSIVVIDATGFAVKGSVATTHKTVGRATEQVDNSAGANGAVNVEVERGVFRFANSAAADLIALADVGADCYIVDDQTVAKTNGAATRSVAGKIRDVDANGVWVEI
jgi:hypothetical protein